LAKSHTMFEFLYPQAHAQATSTALLAEVDAGAMLANVVTVVGDNFDTILIIGATVVGVTVSFWLLRKVIALFPKS
jgi:hypothetical protein